MYKYLREKKSTTVGADPKGWMVDHSSTMNGH